MVPEPGPLGLAGDPLLFLASSAAHTQAVRPWVGAAPRPGSRSCPPWPRELGRCAQLPQTGFLIRKTEAIFPRTFVPLHGSALRVSGSARGRGDRMARCGPWRSDRGQGDKKHSQCSVCPLPSAQLCPAAGPEACVSPAPVSATFWLRSASGWVVGVLEEDCRWEGWGGWAGPLNQARVGGGAPGREAHGQVQVNRSFTPAR